VNFLYRITYIGIVKNLILEWLINKNFKYKIFNSCIVVEQEWLHTDVEMKSWFEFASVQNLPRLQHIWQCMLLWNALIATGTELKGLCLRNNDVVERYAITSLSRYTLHFFLAWFCKSTIRSNFILFYVQSYAILQDTNARTTSMTIIIVILKPQLR
jgi:hypothetical protein